MHHRKKRLPPSWILSLLVLTPQAVVPLRAGPWVSRPCPSRRDRVISAGAASQRGFADVSRPCRDANLADNSRMLRKDVSTDHGDQRDKGIPVDERPHAGGNIDTVEALDTPHGPSQHVVSPSTENCVHDDKMPTLHKIPRGWTSSSTSISFPRSLDSVRASLIRQEETIIFSLIEREQFSRNTIIYTERSFRLHKDGVADIYGRDATFLEYMLCETEKLHGRVRRYMSLEEIAFFPMFLPEPILPPLDFPILLAPNDVNLNSEILRRYISEVVPMICQPGDDDQHGSSIICDINALQALSRRIHLGKFVAESKYQADSTKYQELCRAGDVKGVLDELTNKAVEEKVLERAYAKASTYGRDITLMADGDNPSKLANGEGSEHFKVEPKVIADIYREVVIPLTKDVEILYLFERTGYPCPSLEGIHSPSPSGTP